MATEIPPNGLRTPQSPDADDALARALASSDPAIAMLALQTTATRGQSEEARREVEHQSELIEQLRNQVQDSMKRAEEAQQASGFWGELSGILGGDVATICGVIATAALIVGSGFTGAPAILALVAAGCSIGADVSTRAGLDPKLCIGLSSAGALLGVLGGNLKSTAGVWNTIARASEISQGAATASGGGALIVQRQYEGDALEARADAKNADGLQADAWFRLQMALDILQGAARDLERSQNTVSTVEKDKSAGHSAIIAHMGGVS